MCAKQFHQGMALNWVLRSHGDKTIQIAFFLKPQVEFQAEKLGQINSSESGDAAQETIDPCRASQRCKDDTADGGDARAGQQRHATGETLDRSRSRCQGTEQCDNANRKTRHEYEAAACLRHLWHMCKKHGGQQRRYGRFAGCQKITDDVLGGTAAGPQARWKHTQPQGQRARPLQARYCPEATAEPYSSAGQA